MPARKPKRKTALIKPAAPPRPSHRPPYDPDGPEEAPGKDRRTVRAMAAGNLGQDDIAMVLGISPKTLRKHFAHELRTAFIQAKDTMWRSLFNQGVGSPAIAADEELGIPGSPAIPPNVKATMAWLEYQTDASKRLTVMNGSSELDPKTATEAELDAEIARLSKRPAVLRAAKTTVH